MRACTFTVVQLGMFDVPTMRILPLAFFFGLGLAFAPRDFYSDREAVLTSEAASFLGADIVLGEVEVAANAAIMAMKHRELEEAFAESFYPPSQHFFQSRPVMETSGVFAALRSMPKGAALHVHDLSIASTDWIVSNLTYWPNLYMCDNGDGRFWSFAWLTRPDGGNVSSCEGGWLSVSSVRSALGADVVDGLIRRSITITAADPATEYPDLNSVWSAFGSALGSVTGLVSHESAFRAYVRRGLEDFLADGVQHVELRVDLAERVCTAMDGDCGQLTPHQLTELFRTEADAFKAQHPDDFCGVSLIFARPRDVDPEVVSDYLSLTSELASSFPELVVGLDLVAQEDLGRPLIDFADVLLANDDPNVGYYFHAGETKWHGQDTDANVIDALLLGTRRVGHGYAIVKHPEAMRLAAERNVPLEVCPVSNQVLGLVADLRNHPAAILLQNGDVPVVISSDDPALWESLPLTHDFYETFMGLAAKGMDLRLLKGLVFGSVDHSAMNDADKQTCSRILDAKWSDFVRQMANYV